MCSTAHCGERTKPRRSKGLDREPDGGSDARRGELWGGGTLAAAVVVLLSFLWAPAWVRSRPTMYSSSPFGAPEQNVNSSLRGEQYVVVVDGGSTGSRIFVYRFVHNAEGQREVEGVSSMKASPGLSAFDGRPNEVAAYLKPLIEHAAGAVPEERQASTPFFVKATAGMRLLTESSQQAIYDALHSQLSSDPTFPFLLRPDSIGTLSGRLEGFYAALSVNYLTGRMNTELAPHEPHKEAVIGALDLGGSSTQIVFQHVENNEMELDESDFWVQSYLAYGVDTIRYRLWSHLVRHAPPDVSIDVENPCSFAGYVEHFKGHRLVGTGDGDKCGVEIRMMLWEEAHETCSPNEPCGLDGIRHPPLTGRFLAMSVFFFALDCMKQLGPVDLPHWPSPSIDEIETAAHKFCGQSWTTMNSTFTGLHPFTKDELLPYRCVEVQYIHTLLKHGYGFPGDSRNITFVLNIEGMEVEWTLGYALAEVPDEDIIVPPPSPSALAADGVGASWWESAGVLAEPFLSISIVVACMVVVAVVFRACPGQDGEKEGGSGKRRAAPSSVCS